MRSAIVLGAAGFVGNAVARFLNRKGINVISVLKPGYRETEEASRMEGLETEIVECDLRNIGMLEERTGLHADCFFNFAWEGTDAAAITDAAVQLDNIRWCMDAISVAKKLGCRKYVGVGAISQRELLSSGSRSMVSERHRYYRAAHDCCENMGRALAKDIGIGFAWPVLINVYGEDRIADRFINRFVRSMMDGVEMKLSSGTQLYDFLHMEDAARALYLVAADGKEKDSYVIGSGASRTLKEYLIEAKNIVNPEYTLEFDTGNPGMELPFELIDSRPFCKDYAFEPEIGFNEGIQRLMEAGLWA